ncbi:ABC transporter ATP-binding protein [Dictyobacter arantiisoli]|uniref:ABC transporter ATP-binding protein n=1 Tax=Dictyobacter arantiisoli TaxID=2014874 RepID=A0A5A5TAP0_9CHLR|nr:energy-coupling factor transporter ATPase [Dictyobacter arantiisoli]GCF08073.1 ABC transporter ATP-binding protein [Dictyobacter arantiisoli]
MSNSRINIMIELQNVTFNYSAQGERNVAPALQDISLRIPEGQTVAIIGHNGSGKSTLTKLISAIVFPQSGSITIDGLRVEAGGKDLWSIRERVGVVFQNPDDQLIAGTVIDEVAFGPENLGLPRSEIAERVHEAMATMDLLDAAQLSLSELSVSMKQRVAIAGVLAMRPRYLVLDEPTTMISGQTVRQLLATLHRLARERGMAIIYITHFMQEIADFERVIAMDGGHVLMDGSPATVFARADELRAVGLDVPVVTQLGHDLSQQGWTQIPPIVLSSEQLVAAFQSDQTTSAEPGLDALSNLPSSEIHSEDSTPLFDLRAISYIHRNNTPFAQEALHDFTLSVRTGEAVALVGATGSGKSTLIDLLAGLIKPASGRFYFGGENTGVNTFKMTRLRACVGVVFQSPESQIFEETVGKDVSFGPRQQKLPLHESRRLVQSSLEAVGLPYEDFRSRYTYALSGGQKRRVAIAGVLALEPKVIIFDEPMAGLDPRGRAELFALIRALRQREGLTICYASSSLKEVSELVDTVHILDKGRIVLSGTPREILTHAQQLAELDIALPEASQLALSLRHAIPSLRTDVLDLAELETALLKVHSVTL